MDLLSAIHGRNSVALLQEPGPAADDLDDILKAGLRASDHRRLKPWRFLVVKGDARIRLGELMLEIALQENPAMDEAEQEKCRAKPLRAPLIVVVVAATQPEHFEKVPEIEQLLSAGGAAQLMVLAAQASGYGAIWRTGPVAYDARIKPGLGLGEADKIVGFLYMGKAKNGKPLPKLDLEGVAEVWEGPA